MRSLIVLFIIGLSCMAHRANADAGLTADHRKGVQYFVEFLADKPMSQSDIKRLNEILDLDYNADPATSRAIYDEYLIFVKVKNERPSYLKKMRARWKVYQQTYFVCQDASLSAPKKEFCTITLRYAPSYGALDSHQVVLGTPHMQVSEERETFIRSMVGAPTKAYTDKYMRDMAAELFASVPDKSAVSALLNQYLLNWDTVKYMMHKHYNTQQKATLKSQMTQAYVDAGKGKAGVVAADAVLAQAANVVYQELLAGLKQSQAGLAKAYQQAGQLGGGLTTNGTVLDSKTTDALAGCTDATSGVPECAMGLGCYDTTDDGIDNCSID